MQFNNRQFESGVQQSLGTLEKLKGALNFDKSEKSMSSLERAFRNFDLSSFGDNLQKIADRFSTMGIIGDQVVRRLTDAFMGLAGQITNTVKSMTVDQIAAGWGKYEDKTASVQTIMNATGKSINEVNQYLDKLMWFSDETSYGFTDMTAALGQLTTAGGDIDKLIPMIEGIANATAYAGKGPAEFSRAIYNLNQSYGSGALKYMDWKSLELAGVASKELKQTIIDTAVAMGKIDKGAVDIGNFAETLKDNWADTEVMEAAFGKFGQVTEEAYKLVQAGEFDTASDAYEALAGQFDNIYYKAARSAQEAKSFGEVIDATKDAVSSGWMKTFEILFGNYEEAKVLWTDMANSFWEIFASGADSRNELLEEWHESQVGGYEDFREAIHNILEAIILAKETLGDIVHSILPELDSTHLINATKAFKDFSLKAKLFFGGNLSEDELLYEDKVFGNMRAGLEKARSAGERFASGFAGIVHLVNIARKGFLTLKNSLSPIGQIFRALGLSSLKIFDALGYLFGILDDSIKVTDGFKSSIEGVSKTIADFISKVGDKIPRFIYTTFGFDEATGKIKIFTENFSGLKTTIDSFKTNKNIQNFFDTIIGIKDAASFVLREGLSILKYVPKLFPTIGAILSKFGSIVLSVTGFIGRMFSKINNFTKSGSILSGIINLLVAGFKKLGVILKPVGEKIKEIFSVLSAGNFEGFKNILSGLFSGAGIFSLMTMTKSGKGFLGSISGTFDGISGLLERFKGQDDTAKQILNIGIAIGILATSLLLLSSIKPEALSVGINGLTTLFIEIGTFMLALKEMSGPKGKSFDPINRISTALIKIAASMLIFGLALKLLSKIDPEGMSNALMAFSGVLVSITGFMLVMKNVASGGKAKDIKRLASAVSGIAVGMLIFSAAMKVFSTMSLDQIAVGLTAITGFLASITVMYAAFDKMKNVNAGKILAVGASIAIISNAMLILSGAIGIISLIPLAGVLKAGAVIAGFMGIIAATAKLTNKNIKGILAAAAAIAVIAPSLLVLSGVIAILGRLKITTLAKGLLAIGGTLLILAVGLKAMQGSLKGAAALVVASGALLMLAPALALLGAMPLKNIAKSLLAIAGTFAVLWLGSVFLSPLIPVILSLSGALLAFGAAMTLIGGSFALLGAGLALISTAGVIGAKTLVESIKIIIRGIGELGKEIVNAIVVIVTSVVEGFVKTIPTILDGLGVVILSILTFLDENIEPITNKVVDIVLKIAGVLTERTPELIEAGVQMIIAFINGLAASITEHEDEITTAVENLLDSIIGVVFDFAAKIAEKIPFIGGTIADALRDVKDLLTGKASLDIDVGVFTDEAKKTMSNIGDTIEAGFRGTTVGALRESRKEYKNDGTFSYEQNPSFTGGFGGTEAGRILNTALNNLDIETKITEIDSSQWRKLLNDFYAYYKMYANDPENTDLAVKALYAGDYISQMMGQDSPFTKEERLAYYIVPEFGGEFSGMYYTDAARKIGETFVNNGTQAGVSAYRDFIESSNLEEGIIYSFFTPELRNGLIDAGIVSGEKYSSGLSQGAKNKTNYSGLAGWMMNTGGIVGSRFISGINNMLSVLSPNVSKAAGDTVKNLGGYNQKAKQEGSSIGSNWSAGFIEGLKNKAQSVINTAVDVANNMVKNVWKALGIASPSKVSHEIGMFWDLGLAEGLKKYEGTIDKASTGITTSLINNISQAVDSAQGMLGDGLNQNDSLIPVLDLDNRAKNIRNLGSVIDNQNDGTLKKRYDRPISSSSINETKTNNYGGFTINVTAPEGKDPSEWARYVMDEIQAEIERREAALA